MRNYGPPAAGGLSQAQPCAGMLGWGACTGADAETWYAAGRAWREHVIASEILKLSPLALAELGNAHPEEAKRLISSAPTGAQAIGVFDDESNPIWSPPSLIQTWISAQGYLRRYAEALDDLAAAGGLNVKDPPSLPGEGQGVPVALGGLVPSSSAAWTIGGLALALGAAVYLARRR